MLACKRQIFVLKVALDGYVKQDIGETRMKRVLVLSDSHGNVGNMIRAVKREEPDMILHLGDCVVDADALRREFPHITMVNVPGNCDFHGEIQRDLLISTAIRYSCAMDIHME